MKGIIIILLYLLVGEGIASLIHNFVPGNVIGMVLLFISLQVGLIKEEWVSSIAEFLTKNMTIMFVPPAVGLISAYEILGNHIITIILAIIVSTMLVLAIIGKMQDLIGKKDERTDK